MKVVKLYGSNFAAYGMDEGDVDDAKIIDLGDGLREFKVYSGCLNEQQFEIVAKETAVGSNRFKGTWKYVASSTIKNLSNKRNSAVMASGKVELRLYGENPCALVGEYEEDSTKGRWVFELGD